MYKCDDELKLREIIPRMRAAARGEVEFPKEDEIPIITLEQKWYLVPSGEFGNGCLVELDIKLINDTNSGRKDRVYSNYCRVIRSMYYIIRGECKPITVKRQGDRYYVEDGKHRYIAHILLGIDKIPAYLYEAC